LRHSQIRQIIMLQPHELMQLAIHKAREGISKGQTPFGCAIAVGDEVIAVSHNCVLADNDITAHAEISALRLANRNTGQLLLEGAQVASTCEPCPMCMSALHWARVDTVYHGASIEDARQAGFNELALPAREVLSQGQSNVTLVAEVCRDECQALFEDWAAGSHQAY
jgi:tRNA(Arg) A34 adenosine deaminase TadA